MAIANNTIRVNITFKTLDSSALADPSSITFRAYDKKTGEVLSTTLNDLTRVSLGVYYFNYLIPRGHKNIDIEFSGIVEGEIITGLAHINVTNP